MLAYKTSFYARSKLSWQEERRRESAFSEASRRSENKCHRRFQDAKSIGDRFRLRPRLRPSRQRLKTKQIQTPNRSRNSQNLSIKQRS